MKKVASIAFVLILSGITIFSAAGQVKPISNTAKMKKMKVPVQYTCTMHPEVISNKPGKCPKCGMALVKKTNVKSKPAMEEMKM